MRIIALQMIALALIDSSLEENLSLFFPHVRVVDCKILKENELKDLIGDFSLFSDKKSFLFVNPSSLKKDLINFLLSSFDEGKMEELVFACQKIDSLRNEVEKRKGKILDLLTEKGWVNYLIEKASSEGVNLGRNEALLLFRLFEKEKNLIVSELQKLITFAFAKKTIDQSDIEALVAGKSGPKNLFGISDAILGKKEKLALSLSKSLLDEGTSLFALLAFLRSQMRNGLHQLLLFNKEGKEALLSKFPYLTHFFERRILELKGFGIERFKKALLLLSECEVQAKSQEVNPHLSLQLLLTKL